MKTPLARLSLPAAPWRSAAGLAALLAAALLAAAPAARAQQPAPDCATRTGFTEELATRRDAQQTQAAAVDAVVKVVSSNVEIPTPFRQTLVAVINEAAQLAWSLPQLAPADLVMVQRLACREGNLAPARIATLVAAAEACARETPAQRPGSRLQCVALKLPGAGAAR